MKEVNPGQQQLFSAKTVGDVEKDIKGLSSDLNMARSWANRSKEMVGLMSGIGAILGGTGAYIALERSTGTDRAAGVISGVVGVLIAGSSVRIYNSYKESRVEVEEKKSLLVEKTAELGLLRAEGIRNGETVLFDPGSFKGEVAIPTS